MWEATRSKAKAVFYCTDNSLTAKAVFLFFALATVGKWFSGITLLYLLFLVGFVWPRLYQEKSHEINALYDHASAIVAKNRDKVLEKLPLERFIGKKKKDE